MVLILVINARGTARGGILILKVIINRQTKITWRNAGIAQNGQSPLGLRGRGGGIPGIAVEVDAKLDAVSLATLDVCNKTPVRTANAVSKPQDGEINAIGLRLGPVDIALSKAYVNAPFGRALGKRWTRKKHDIGIADLGLELTGFIAPGVSNVLAGRDGIRHFCRIFGSLSRALPFYSKSRRLVSRCDDRTVNDIFSSGDKYGPAHQRNKHCEGR